MMELKQSPRSGGDCCHEKKAPTRSNKRRANAKVSKVIDFIKVILETTRLPQAASVRKVQKLSAFCMSGYIKALGGGERAARSSSAARGFEALLHG